MAEHLRQHCVSDSHWLAVLAWLRHDEVPTMELQRSLDDDRAGSVPQPLDWLRAWSVARTTQSWQSAAQAVATEHFITQARNRAAQSRPIEQMAHVMQKNLCTYKRKLPRCSDAIALSVDDSAGYRVVRFRAATLSTSGAALGRAMQQEPGSPHARFSTDSP